MGFKHQAKVYRLVFDDPALAGLEVRARSLSIGELRDDDTSVLEAFAKALDSWNLEDEGGEPLPPTLETLESYPDIDFINALSAAWLNAVAGVDDELGKGSDSGRPSLEESAIPMEPLSPSLAS
jgi:hypothetical protein